MTKLVLEEETATRSFLDGLVIIPVTQEIAEATFLNLLHFRFSAPAILPIPMIRSALVAG